MNSQGDTVISFPQNDKVLVLQSSSHYIRRCRRCTWGCHWLNPWALVDHQELHHPKWKKHKVIKGSFFPKTYCITKCIAELLPGNFFSKVFNSFAACCSKLTSFFGFFDRILTCSNPDLNQTCVFNLKGWYMDWQVPQKNIQCRWISVQFWHPPYLDHSSSLWARSPLTFWRLHRVHGH